MAAKRKTVPRRAIIIHGLAHARAAAAAAATLGRPVRLRSAPGAGNYAGAPWFREILAIVRREFPNADIDGSLDCGDQSGAVLAALRHGVKLIRFHGRGKVREKVRAIAGTCGARLDGDRGSALDLADSPDPEAACRAWLERR